MRDWYKIAASGGFTSKIADAGTIRPHRGQTIRRDGARGSWGTR